MARGRKASSETSEEVKVENVEIEQPTDTNEELSTEPQNTEEQEVPDENNAEAVNDKAEGTEEEVPEPQDETEEPETPKVEEPVEPVVEEPVEPVVEEPVEPVVEEPVEPVVEEPVAPKATEPEAPKKNIKAVIAQEILKRKNGAVKTKKSKSFEEAVRLRLKQGHKITFNEVKASRLAGRPSELSQEREFRTRSLRRN